VRKDITPYYRTLGLNPGAEAAEIRAAYRQMVQQWHPDLFKPGSPMQTTAEDITKEINEAYEQLYRKKLYRNFSPKSERKAEPHTKPERSTAAAPKDEPSDKAKGAPRKKAQPPRPVRKQRSWWWKGARARRWGRWTAAAGVVCGLVFCVRWGGDWIASLSWPSAESPAQAAAEPRPAAPPASKASSVTIAPRNRPEAVGKGPEKRPENGPDGGSLGHRVLGDAVAAAPVPAAAARGSETLAPIDRASMLLDIIELGDTKAKVLSVQGTPDEEGESIVRYGSSVVYFRNGIVTGWLDRYPRLHVRGQPVRALPSLDTFALGSSRGDVVRAQGLPGDFSNSSYTYGTSVVFFDSDRVTGWSDGDTPLRNFEMPRLSFFDLDRLTADFGTSGY
jgi:hypothetical protein